MANRPSNHVTQLIYYGSFIAGAAGAATIATHYGIEGIGRTIIAVVAGLGCGVIAEFLYVRQFPPPPPGPQSPPGGGPS